MKGTDPCHASHPSGTSSYTMSACGVPLSGETPYHAHVNQANRSQRQHQRGSPHPERAHTQRSKQLGLRMSPERQGQAAAENKDPTATSRCARDPDRRRNSLAKSGKEGVSRGMELPATAGAGSTLNPELSRSREATTALARSRRLRPERQLPSLDCKWSRDRRQSCNR